MKGYLSRTCPQEGANPGRRLHWTSVIRVRARPALRMSDQSEQKLSKWINQYFVHLNFFWPLNYIIGALNFKSVTNGNYCRIRNQPSINNIICRRYDSATGQPINWADGQSSYKGRLNLRQRSKQHERVFHPTSLSHVLFLHAEQSTQQLFRDSIRVHAQFAANNSTWLCTQSYCYILVNRHPS